MVKTISEIPERLKKASGLSLGDSYRSDTPLGVVGNPYDDLIANIHKGDFVLDLGCGRGFGILTVAQRIGPKGRYLGVDINGLDMIPRIMK